MTLFDRYVVVDWSAASRPTTGRDSIWIADLDAVGGTALCTNPSTRVSAEAALTRIADDAVDGRVLLAVDAPLGYPAGSARWFGLDDDPPWRAMWREIAGRVTDDAANVNNRFEVAGELNRHGAGAGPFWGRPASRPVAGLTATKPDRFPVPEWRGCERELREEGRRPASCWQLLGAGSVGGQALTLLPVLERLRGRLVAAGRPAEIWPMTCGFEAPEVGPGGMVVVEAWPTAFDLESRPDVVRDEAQVDGVAHRLGAADRAGELADWFAPALDGATVASAVAEEAWILRPPSGRTGNPG